MRPHLLKTGATVRSTDPRHPADPNDATDTRPEILAAITTTIDALVRPPTVAVRLQLKDEVRDFRLPAGTAAAATVLTLLFVVRRLDRPAHMSLGLDDPTVARLLTARTPAPPWLRHVADTLDRELAHRGVAVEVLHLDLGDTIAPAPYGCG